MPSPSAAPLSGKLAVDSVPFINERIRNYLAGDYSASGDYKAFALNIGGFTGAALNQPTEEAARNMALEQCQKRADAAQSPRRCELYAVGNDVVYTHGKPPMPRGSVKIPRVWSLETPPPDDRRQRR
ncbi:adenylate cyclase [Bradyrhizobium japonicum]|nr:adenylate cyclase [Bradyrhizobium japonicum]MCP1774658.1 adenylate cyclase [Bradyrhizobium japonicum]MCP1865728.1 adenylate cyclase [Bradyrhizobium japonicum]MCP1895501.1 adenylate cyclase [Bradyrhizobium japonicum]MCP1962340.1 adenylate cyclase [Bradyrhizobium japonicum]